MWWHASLHCLLLLLLRSQLARACCPPLTGYAWQCAYCGCGQHLGWKFLAVRPGLHPASFWGLRRPALHADGNREPGPPGRRYLDGGGSSSEGELGDAGWTSPDEVEGEEGSEGDDPLGRTRLQRRDSGSEGSLLDSGGSDGGGSEGRL